MPLALSLRSFAWLLLPGVLAAQEPKAPVEPARAAVSPQPAAVLDPRASVVLVRAEDGAASAGGSQIFRQGSGVVMAPGMVVTNAHVVGAGGAITVRYEGITWQARVRSLDRARDLCLLSVPGLTRPPVKAADPGQRKVGMAVKAIGFPAQTLRISKGSLTGIWHAPGGQLLQTDAPIAYGSSGGGLFDEAGRLLGLTTLVFEKTSGISFSVAVESLDSLLDLPAPSPDLTVPRDIFPELVQSIAAHPENHPAWEAFTLTWVRLSPRDPEAWYARGCALHMQLRADAEAHRGQKGQALDEPLWKESVAAFRQATELGADFAQAWNNLGSLLEMNNRFEEAEAALRRSLELAPDYSLAWVNLGRTRFNARRYLDAAAAYRSALNYRPFDGQLWWSLGLCEVNTGAAAQGLAHLEKAAGILPDSAEIWADVARHRARQDRRGEALLALDRLRELDPALAAEVAKEIRRR